MSGRFLQQENHHLPLAAAHLKDTTQGNIYYVNLATVHNVFIIIPMSIYVE